jgi:hypothetical protein
MSGPIHSRYEVIEEIYEDEMLVATTIIAVCSQIKAARTIQANHMERCWFKDSPTTAAVYNIIDRSTY